MTNENNSFVDILRQKAGEYAREAHSLDGTHQTAAYDAFLAGARWAGALPIERLVPRGVPESVPLTEIMAGVIGGREDAAKSFFNVGVMVSDLHADVRSIKSMIAALADAIGSHHKTTTGGLVETQGIIRDVGEKVEAVLDQVTPRDNGPYAEQPADTAESEADHWKRLYSSASEAVEKHKTTIRHERELVGKLQSQIAGLKDQLGDVMAERDEWKASAILLDKSKSEPVTDESGISVGAGSFLLNPPAWAGAICDTIVHGGLLIVACQNGVFRLDGDRLTPLRFVRE